MKQLDDVGLRVAPADSWRFSFAGRAALFCRDQTALRLLLASLLPGLPFIVARIVLHQHSGIFNIDFVLITMLAAAGYRRVASVVFLFAYLLESIRLLDAVYFFSEQDVTFAAHFLADVAGWVVAAWLLAFVAVSCACLALWWMITPSVSPAKMRASALPVLALVAVGGAIDVSQGFNPFLVKPHGRPRPHLIGEVLVRMPVELSRAVGRDEGSTMLPHSATDPLWGASDLRARRENVVVVIVESMGLLTDAPARQREFEAIEDDPAVLKRYQVSEGAVPFTGSTVVGEMRELCHLRTNVHIGPATLAGKPACLPSQFRSLGYQTVSYHGYRRTMFSRAEWYPKIGFQQMNFAAEMKSLPHCNGAFYGVCDAAIASAMEKRLAAAKQAGGPPQFLYWMTLNSHLPIDTGAVPAHTCPVAADGEVCGQLGLIAVVLDSVKKLALDPAIGPTAIVVVGDHAPPYADVVRRDLFDDGNVPFLVMQPKF